MMPFSVFYSPRTACTLIYTTRERNITLAVTVSSEKKKALTLKSAWITKKGQHISPQSDVQAPNQTSDNELSMNAVNNSISQENGFVNSENLATPVGQARNYAKIFGMDENGTRGLATLAEDLPDGVDLGEVALAFNAIYSQGKSGKAFSAAKNMELLSPEQRHYAYNLGIMDKALDSARAKNAAAEISGENSGKVLQKDGVGGTIKKSNNLANEAKNEEEFNNETITSISKSKLEAQKSNSRTQRAAGSESSIPATMQKNGGINDRILLQRNRRGIESTLRDLGFNDKDIVSEEKNATSYPIKEFLSEYGIDCLIIKDSSWKRKSQAASKSGIVFVKETVPKEYLKRMGPHEVTHIMKQVGYKPYLDFLNRTPIMFDFSTPEARFLLNRAAEHCNVDIILAHDSDFARIYDEFNATFYGHIASGLLDERTDWMRAAFYDFDGYVQDLIDIHKQFKKDFNKTSFSSSTPDAQKAKESSTRAESSNSDVQHSKGNNAEWDAERIKDGKVLQKDGVGDTIKENESRRENSDGTERKVGNTIFGRRDNKANSGEQYTERSKEHRGDEGTVTKGRLDRRGNREKLVTEDSSGRELSLRELQDK